MCTWMAMVGMGVQLEQVWAHEQAKHCTHKRQACTRAADLPAHVHTQMDLEADGEVPAPSVYVATPSEQSLPHYDLCLRLPPGLPTLFLC